VNRKRFLGNLVLLLLSDASGREVMQTAEAGSYQPSKTTRLLLIPQRFCAPDRVLGDS